MTQSQVNGILNYVIFGCNEILGLVDDVAADVLDVWLVYFHDQFFVLCFILGKGYKVTLILVVLLSDQVSLNSLKTTVTVKFSM